MTGQILQKHETPRSNIVETKDLNILKEETDFM